MQVFRGLENYKKLNQPVVTLGTFDGVHIGHRKIIDRVIASAKELGGTSMIITFEPHPRKVLFPHEKDLKLINTLEEKLELFERCGIENVLVLNFTQQLSRKSSMDFAKEILAGKLEIRKIIIGYNHHFGFGRGGNYMQLLEAGRKCKFEVEEIPPQQLEEVSISSTIIRKALFCGNIELANRYLGEPFFFNGLVVEGAKVGRILGFPTANLRIENDEKIIPFDGVYIARIEIDGKQLPAMLYIGSKPTFENGGRWIEVNILNFSDNLYNRKLKVIVEKRIRGDKKFPDAESLRKQIEEDLKTTQAYFNLV